MPLMSQGATGLVFLHCRAAFKIKHITSYWALLSIAWASPPLYTTSQFARPEKCVGENTRHSEASKCFVTALGTLGGRNAKDERKFDQALELE